MVRAETIAAATPGEESKVYVQVGYTVGPVSLGDTPFQVSDAWIGGDRTYRVRGDQLGVRRPLLHSFELDVTTMLSRRLYVGMLLSASAAHVEPSAGVGFVKPAARSDTMVGFGAGAVAGLRADVGPIPLRFDAVFRARMFDVSVERIPGFRYSPSQTTEGALAGQLSVGPRVSSAFELDHGPRGRLFLGASVETDCLHLGIAAGGLFFGGSS